MKKKQLKKIIADFVIENSKLKIEISKLRELVVKEIEKMAGSWGPDDLELPAPPKPEMLESDK